jgi:hypothetical protein
MVMKRTKFISCIFDVYVQYNVSIDFPQEWNNKYVTGPE